MATGTDPFADLLTLQRDVDRIMSKFGAEPRRAGEDGHSFWMPPVDVAKQGDSMVVRVDLPGVNPGDISVSVTGNMLTIKGERKQDQRTQEGDYVMRETTAGAFERRITMPQEIDATQVKAQFRAGVLEVTVPSTALITPQPRQVPVGAAQQQPSFGQQTNVGTQQQQQQQYGQQPQQGQTYGTQQGQTYGQPQGGQTYGQPYGHDQTRAQSDQQSGGHGTAQVQGGWVNPEQSGQTPGQGQQTQGASDQQMSASYQAPQNEQAEPEGEESERRSPFGWRR